MNHQERIPTAPRAMLNSERVRLLENLVRLREQSQALSTPESQNLTPVIPHNPVIQIPIPLPATIPSTPANINSHPMNSPIPGPTPANAPMGGIAIPMDPKFFSPITLREREEGEVSSSSATPKRLSSDCTRGKQAVYSPDERDHKRRSSSPEPVRHRLPSSRTYCNPRSPEGARRPSPPRNSSKSSRLSRSPRRIKRPYSPDRRRSRPSPSPEAAHRCSRRASSPNIWPPRPFEPKSPHPSPHRRRASEYDPRATKSRNNEPFRANTFPDFSNIHGNNHIPFKDLNSQELNPKDNAPAASEEAPSLDHRRSDHERRQAVAQGQEATAESPQAPTMLMSPATTTDSTRGIGEPAQHELLRPTPQKSPTPPELPLTTKRTPSPPQFQAKLTGGPPGHIPSPTPSPVSRFKGLPEDVPMQELAPSIPPSIPAPSVQEVKLCHNVPGLWMVKAGLATVEILTCEFEIDEIAADRWGIRGSSRYAQTYSRFYWYTNSLEGTSKKS